MKQFECYTVDHPDWKKRVFAPTRGKAKSQFHLDITDVCDGYPFTNIRAREVRDYVTSDAFRENAAYRKIPFAYVGMKVSFEHDGEGIIVGHNSSANLNVYFTSGRHMGHTLNCHPQWRIAYHDETGAIIKSYFAS